MSVRYFLVTETYIGRHWGLTQSLSVVTWYMPADLKMKATSNMCPFESQVSFYSGGKEIEGVLKNRLSNEMFFSFEVYNQNIQFFVSQVGQKKKVPLAEKV